MKAEELLAPFRVWLHWCRGIKASWKCLLIKSWRIFQRDFKSKIPILLHIYVFLYIYMCSLNVYVLSPSSVLSSMASPGPARVAPGRLSRSQVRLSREPRYSQGTQGVRTLSPNEWSHWPSIQQRKKRLIPQLCCAIFSSGISWVSRLLSLLTRTGSEHPPAISARGEANL